MAAQKGTDPSARSPYRPGMGLDPPYLGDREEQIQRFRDFLEEPEARHNALVTGLRGGAERSSGALSTSS
jgi:hypothetical protein